MTFGIYLITNSDESKVTTKMQLRTLAQAILVSICFEIFKFNTFYQIKSQFKYYTLFEIFASNLKFTQHYWILVQYLLFCQRRRFIFICYQFSKSLYILDWNNTSLFTGILTIWIFVLYINQFLLFFCWLN